MKWIRRVFGGNDVLLYIYVQNRNWLRVFCIRTNETLGYILQMFTRVLIVNEQ